MRRFTQVASLALALILVPLTTAWAVIDVVVDYSADPTYTNNNSTAFTNAVNAAAVGGGRAGEVVMVPPGTYKFTNVVTVPDGVRLRCENWHQSILKRDYNGPIFQMTDGVNVTIENCGFDGNGYEARMVKIGPGTPANCNPFVNFYTRLRDLRFFGSQRVSGGGPYIWVEDNACQVVFDHISTVDGTYGIRNESANSPTYVSDSVFYRGYSYGLVAGGAGYGFLLYDSFILGDCVSGANCTATGILMNDDTFQLHVRGSYIENLTTYAISLAGDFTDLKLQDNYGLGTISFGAGNHRDVTVQGNTIGSSPVSVNASATFPSPYALSWAGNVYTGTVPTATGSTAVPKEFIVSGNSHAQPGQQGVTVGATYTTTKTITNAGTWQLVAQADFSHVHRAPHGIKFIADLWCYETSQPSTTTGAVRMRAGVAGSETTLGLQRPASQFDNGFVTQMAFIPDALFSWNGGDLRVIVEMNLSSGGVTCNSGSDYAALISYRPE